MEVQAIESPSSSSMAAYPPWVMLEPDADVETTGSYATADPKTLVVARTATGHPFGVSLRLASPPAESRVCVHFPQDSKPRKHANEVVAAHGDSVLIKVVREEDYDIVPDYFVYSAGTAATGADSPQPPSLSLLPPCCHWLNHESTGILRRGEDELVVARLDIERVKKDKKPSKYVSNVLLFRSGGKWMEGQPGISGLGNSKEEKELLSSWWGRSVIPIGDEMLCWVDTYDGLIFSDVWDESPGLRYVPLPAGSTGSGNVCVTAGDAVKLVKIFARCCCGGAGGGTCENSSDHAYLIKTWTLRMDSMTWVMDGMMDATELWALDPYKSLPRIQAEYPVVSMNEAHIICFMLCNKKVWLVMVDMRSKTLLSVHSYPKSEKLLLPSKVSYYLNPKNPGSSIKTDIEQQPAAILDEQLTDGASNSQLLHASMQVNICFLWKGRGVLLGDLMDE